MSFIESPDNQLQVTMKKHTLADATKPGIGCFAYQKRDTSNLNKGMK
jgi:hypothetical protein